MIRGVAVTVRTPSFGDADRLGNRAVTFSETMVRDGLVSPGATSDLDASRPEGVSVAYTLHFPKTFTGALEGCEIVLPAPWAGTYRVVGNPRPYIGANTPTRWHMPCEVEAAHG